MKDFILFDFTIVVLLGITTLFGSELKIYEESGSVNLPDPCAAGSIIYVDTNAMGAGNGTSPGDAYTNIQAAIDAIETCDGDTLMVAAGIYVGSITINKELTILGPQAGVDPRPCVSSSRVAGSGSEAILDGQNLVNTIVEIEVPNVTLDGFEVKSGLSDLIASQTTGPVKSGLLIQNNIVHNATGDEGMQLRKIRHSLIQKNYLYDIAQDAINVCCTSDSSTIQYNEITDANSDNGTIYIYNMGKDIKILCNKLYANNNNDGIKMGIKDGGDRSIDSEAVVSGNTISGQRQDGISIYTSSVRVDSNTITGSRTDNGAIFLQFDISDVTVSHNHVYDNEGNGLKIGDKVENVISHLVTNNSIYNNEEYDVDNQGGEELIATCNWWGTTEQTALDTLFDGDIEYVPYLNSGADDNPAQKGFQPEFGSCIGGYNVINISRDPIQGYLTIQSGADAADPCDTLVLAEHTFIESVSLSQKITILGANGASSLLRPPGSCTGTGIEILSDSVSLSNIDISGFCIGIAVKGVDNTSLTDMKLNDNCNYGIDVDADSKDFNLERVEMNNNVSTGFRVANNASLENLWMRECELDSNIYGMYLTYGTYSVPSNVNGVNILRSTFNGNTRKGIYAEKLSNALFDSITVDGSGVDLSYGFNNGIDINLKWQSYENIVIKNSQITRCGNIGSASDYDNPAAIAIKARDDAPSYSGTPASLDDVLLYNNLITGPENGVRFGEFGKVNAGPTNTRLEMNDLSFAFDDYAVLNNTNSDIDFDCNWHGPGGLATAEATTLENGAGDNVFITVSNDASFLSCYCNSTSTYSMFNHIEKVSLISTIDTVENESFDDGGYGYFPTPVNILPGEPLTIDLRAFTINPISYKYWKIWIDWDQDGEFEFHEVVYMEEGNQLERTAHVNMKKGHNGLRNMRITMALNSGVGPCDEFGLGEVEDYVIEIAPCIPSLTIDDMPVDGYYKTGLEIKTVNSVTAIGNTVFKSHSIFLGPGFEVPKGWSFETIKDPCLISP